MSEEKDNLNKGEIVNKETNESEKTIANADNTHSNKSKIRINNNIKIIAIMIIIAITCLGIGFTRGKEVGRELPATWKNYNENKIIATVGEADITEKELGYMMKLIFLINGKDKLSEYHIEAYEYSMIDYITTTEVLYQEGKENNIEVNEEDVILEYETIMQYFEQDHGITEDDILNIAKIPESAIKSYLEKELIATEYIGQATDVSDAEAKNYYEKNKEEFLKVRASHILISNIDEDGNVVSDEQKEKNRQHAEEILEQAKLGVDFEELARTYSDDSSAQTGGDLGFFYKGQMVEVFETAAFALEIDEIDDEIVESEFGYHIIKKTDEDYDDFEVIEEEIKYSLSYLKQQNLMLDLSEKYSVTINM